MMRLRRLSCLLIVVFLVSACRLEPVDQPSAPTPTIRPDAASPSLPEPTTSPEAEQTPVHAALPEGLFWWNETKFYEIFVRSFYDSSGDGNGDFQGLIAKLDYLNDNQSSTTSDLGISGIWLMPIFPSPSYHGYDVTDYTSINPDYGTMEDFKQFLEQAHRRGIKVIIDMPLNHTSSAHPWFQKALENDPTYRDYYIWSEDDPGYMGPWGQDPWHESINSDYYYGIFWSEMPDLNYDNPAVVDEMKDIFKFWLEVGVDGFRLDGARYIIEEDKKQADTPSTHQFYQELRNFVKGINPEALLLGEVWTDAFTTSTYTKNGDELDLVFDFELANALMSSATSGNADKALNGLKFSQKLFSGGRSAPFLTNHDMDRVMSTFGGDVKKAKNAAFMLLTAPGVPFMYYGEEIGMQGKRGSEDTDINRRLPMQWTGGENAGFTTGTPWAPIHPSYEQNNVEALNPIPDSLLSTYRDLLTIRAHEPALRYGDTYVIESDNSALYSLIRSIQGENVLVLINLSGEPVTDYSLNLDEGPLSGNYELIPLHGNEPFVNISANPQGGFDAYQPIPTLPSNGRYIYKLQPQK
jgi:glycosidase